MFLDDWHIHKKETVSNTILWEYDTTAPAWDWQRMKSVVVERVLEYGMESDYYAMYQLYGGYEGVRKIVKELPYLEAREAAWACALFNLDKEDLWSYRRMSLRRKHLNS